MPDLPATGNEVPLAPKKPSLRSRASGADPEALNLRELTAVVRRNWWVVLAGIGLVSSIAAVVAYNAPPRFRAKGVIKLANIRQAMTGSLSNDNTQSSVGLYSDPLVSQIQVLTSRTVAAVVVDSEPALLRVRATGIALGVLTDVRIAKDAVVDSVRLSFAAQSVVATAGGVTARAAYGAPLFLPGVQFTITAPPATSDAATLLIVSRDAAATALATAIKATPRPESDVIDVEYVGAEAGSTKQVVNRLLNVFTASSAASAQQRSRQRLDFIQQQLAHNDSLEAASQSTLTDFRVRERMYSGKDRASDGQKDVVTLDVERGSLASDRDVARSLLAGLLAARGAERARVLRTLVSTSGINANPIISQLYDQLVRFRSTRDSMTTGRFSSAATNPDVQRLDTLITSNENQLAEAVQSYIGSLTVKIDVLDQARQRSNVALDRLPSVTAEEARLATQVASIHRVGDQLREELQKAAIAGAVSGGEVEIVDLASTATSLSGGRLPKVFIGLLVGLVLGIGAAFVREHLNTTIKRREDVERFLHLAPVGVIPSIDKEYVRRRTAAAAKEQNPSSRRGSAGRVPREKLSRRAQKDAVKASLGIEAFASLRTHLRYLPDGNALKTIVVTSCAPRDGKSTVSANIAEAYARSGTRVLLIDCDLRRPRLHEVFHQMVEVGLTEVLIGTISLEAAVRPVAESKSMFLLTAGSRVSNPSELIGGDAMKDFLISLRSKFDLIILDSPPVLVVSDAEALSTRADGVLFVVRAGSTEPVAARAGVAQLEAVGGKMLGVVLNDPDDTLTRYDADYYYTYYNDYFDQAIA